MEIIIVDCKFDSQTNLSMFNDINCLIRVKVEKTHLEEFKQYLQNL